MNQLRQPNGRFVTQSQLNRKRRNLENFQKTKKLKQENVSETESSNESSIDGWRIVHIKQFGKNLKCSKCNELLSLDNISKEIRSGFNSTFKINCEKCKEITCVSTGTISNSNNEKYYDINTMAVLGKILLLILIYLKRKPLDVYPVCFYTMRVLL